MSMIRKRSHPSGSGAKKEKATQPETSKCYLHWVYFEQLMVYNFSIHVCVGVIVDRLLEEKSEEQLERNQISKVIV